tara:strand:- start:514 stop:2070 length:1557 start_codon:yes stop_codon:yes gene_type:complete
MTLGIARTRPTSTSKTLPAPTGGWDTRHALASMPSDNAVILDNFFPETENVTLRAGSASHATGMSGNVETLMEYAPLTGVNELYACNNGGIYEVTDSGAVSSAVVTGRSNNRFQHTQIGTAGGQFLFACNGADTPQTYNGSAWANSTVSGPTIANLIWCTTHQARIFFGEEDSLSFWYLDTRVINGTALEFALDGIFKRGGYIMAMGSWTRDGGSGPDDVAVFYSSEGEIAVYSGTDPSSASTWALVGVFLHGRPVGRRCITKVGSSLALISENGFQDVASILSVDRSSSENVAISKQINDAVNGAVRSYGDLFGWQPILYPRSKMLIFNVPISTTEMHQYVFNSLTGAPCRFKGLNALCWGTLGDRIFFGKIDGTVHEFDGTESGGESPTSDDGVAIAGDAMAAFSYFGSKGSEKAFKLVEPIFMSTGNPSPALDLNVDFTTYAPVGVASPLPNSAGQWGVATWGVSLWGKSDQIFKGWMGVRGHGRSASLRVRITSAVSRPSWISTNYTFVRGGQI